jgi:hypothetical protein
MSLHWNKYEDKILREKGKQVIRYGLYQTVGIISCVKDLGFKNE